MKTVTVPILTNWYVVAWSIFNFLLLALAIAVPIVCIVLLVKMNRRLKHMEEEMEKMSNGDQVLK